MRKFLAHQNFRSENTNSEETKSDKKNLLTRNDDSMDEDDLRINTKVQIKENVECGQCKKETKCMRVLVGDLIKKQTNKMLRSIEQIVDLLFVRISVYPMVSPRLEDSLLLIRLSVLVIQIIRCATKLISWTQHRQRRPN